MITGFSNVPSTPTSFTADSITTALPVAATVNCRFKPRFCANKKKWLFSSFNLRKFEMNQDFISDKQLVRDEGGRMKLGFLER